MTHFPQNDAAFCFKSEQVSFDAKCTGSGSRNANETVRFPTAIIQRSCDDNDEMHLLGRAIGTNVASYSSERLVASPNLSVRNDFPHIHTSHMWHGGWLICESQPNPVPTPLF
jgi:hypothetical protein